jgi:hypothetical protein
LIDIMCSTGNEICLVKEGVPQALMMQLVFLLRLLLLLMLLLLLLLLLLLRQAQPSSSQDALGCVGKGCVGPGTGDAPLKLLWYIFFRGC